MTKNTKAIPAKSWAYPLYDLALVGWIFAVIPVSGYLALGRINIAGIIVGGLVLVSAAAILFGRRDGISIVSYLDSSSSTRVRFRQQGEASGPPRRPPST